MFNEPLLLAALAGLAMACFWWIAPRCPECGYLLSFRDGLDPSLRHCRRCLAIFRKEQRR
jgi:hypothetical protein